MPQDGSNNYQYPPGTPGIPDQTIESEAYNTFLDDLVLNDLNIARPIHRGGTGATNADTALINLHGERAEQVVTAYLSQLWLPGSFRSAIGATDAPVAGHSFAGICYINEPLVSPPTNANVTVEARDMTDGKLYVRQKTSGVWGAWLEQAGVSADLDAAYVNVTGDTMSGLLTMNNAPITMTGVAAFLTLAAAPTLDLHAATKAYVDGGVNSVTNSKISVIRVQLFPASGTYTPHANMLFCWVRLAGGGGSGAGVANPGANQTAQGSGGGAGGYTEKIFSKAAVGASQTVTVGAAGSSTGGNGNTGGTTSFGALLSATGGGGGATLGPITSAGQTPGGVGGIGAGGDITSVGAPGEWACGLGGGSIPMLFPGNGGSGVFSGGGLAGQVAVGSAASGYGGGGGGASSYNGAGGAGGGSGAPGVVIVTEFCSI